MKKKFEVAVKMPHGSVIIHAGEFDPTTSDVYRIYISPTQGRHSLVVKEVRRYAQLYEDELMRAIESMPVKLQKQLANYTPLADMEFREWLRRLRKEVVTRCRL